MEFWKPGRDAGLFIWYRVTESNFESYRSAETLRHPRSRCRSHARPRLLDKEFLDRLPVVGFPSGGQGFGLAFRKAGMVEYDLGAGALLHEFELRNGIDAERPAAGAPGLHDALVWNEFDVTSGDVAAEEGEGASY